MDCKVSLRNAVNNSTKVRSNKRPMMILGRPAGNSRERKGASCARGGPPGGIPVSGKALPAHEASQRGAPVSGEVLPAHEADQRGIPVSGEALPAHEASQRGDSRERKGASCARD